MADQKEETCAFLVLATFSGMTLPYFVMATCTMHAFDLVQLKLVHQGIRHVPELKLNAHVMGPESFRDVMPDIKEVARSYFIEGVQATGVSIKDTIENDFETSWQQHGPMPTKAGA